MKKLQNWPCVAVFTVFCLTMTVLLLGAPGRDYSENEKRHLAKSPEFSLSAFLDGSLQKGLEDWTADQFPFRDNYVGLNAYWTLASGRNAVQDIYYCKNGYLINAPKTEKNGTFENNLTQLNNFAADCDIPAEMILIPSTGHLKEDLLPDGHLPYQDDMLFAKAKETLINVTFYDFREELKAADTPEQNICYRTDHHLTVWGNQALYRAYLDAHDAYPWAQTFTPTPGFYGTTWSGSGYWGVNPDDIYTWDSHAEVTVTITDSGQEPVVSDSVFFPAHLAEMDKYPVYLDGNHTLVKIENPGAADDTTLLIVKDSYAHCFTAMLAENYQTIYMIDLRYYRDSVSDFIETNGVDRLLYFYGVDTLLTDTNSAWLR